MSASVIVLIIYLAVIFGIGLYNGRAGVKNEEDYYLGDRSFGPLPTAISMGATDSSGWIFIGAIGYAYLAGPVSFWMYPGFAVLIAKLGGWGAFWSQAVAIDPVMGTLTGGAAGSAAVGVILGLLFYGLGEFGQPHILQRFFSAKDDNTLKYGTIVSSLWMIGVMCGSSILGCLARVYIDGLEDAEYAFPTLVNQMMPAVVSGIVVGAIFAAVQSTFSSQLLVAVQAVASNIIKPLSKREYSDSELVKIGKITMVVLCVLSTAIALLNIDSVFSLVVYAWSGLASAFGPLCILLIYRPHKVNRGSAVAGMIVGLVVSTAWYMAGLGVWCMELVPGMIVSWLVIEAVGSVFSRRERKI